MNKKTLNIILIALQWLISLLLIVYLLVPIYNTSSTPLYGDSIYSPYENWEKSPVQIVHIKDGFFIGTSPDSILRLQHYLNQQEIFVLDSASHTYHSPFFLGHSRDDLQFLIKKSGLEEKLVSNSIIEEESYHPPLRGIKMQLIESLNDISLLDEGLENGIPMLGIAGQNDSSFSYNLLMTSSGNPYESMLALRNGRNLMVFSKEKIYSDGIEKIPVIRSIDWKNNTLKIDLSEKGNIRIVSSAFQLDTLANNLSLKLNNPSWFRFEVRFLEDKIIYISNPFFRYSGEPFKTIYPKANNQLTIFINLSWLFGIILLNVLVNKLREKYL